MGHLGGNVALVTGAAEATVRGANPHPEAS